MFLIDNGKESKLYDIVVEYDSVGAERELEPKAINKRAHQKYGYLAAPISTKLKLSQIEKTDTIHLKSYYSTWFSINKSQPLGRLIGLNLREEDIPEIYKQVIIKSKSLC
jgi:hypothetical protein